MKPHSETLHRACLIAHTAPAEIHTRPQHHAHVLHRSAADQGGRTTVDVLVLAQPYEECDAEELAAMDVVVHCLGD